MLFRLCGFVAGFSIVFSGFAMAQQPDALPGWEVDSKRGVVLGSGNITFSSPVIADIDGNPANGLEVAVGATNGRLFVVGADGSLRWSADLPNYNCEHASGGNKLFSSPSVGKLFGNDIPYVVIGYGGFSASGCGGGVVAYRGTDGVRRFHFNTKRFARKQRFWANQHTVFSTPSLGNLKRNKLFIGFGSFDRSIYLLKPNGKPMAYWEAADTVWSSPAFANVDSKNRPEMIIGTDISANSQLNPPTQNGGNLYALKTRPPKGRNSRGRRNKKHSFRSQKGSKWIRPFDQVLYSSPVVADIIPESPGNEIVIASGCFFPQSSSSKRGRWLKVVSASNGEVLRTLNAATCSASAPAVADIDDDGLLEVISSTNGSSSVGGDGYSRVQAWDPESSSEPKWSVIPRHNGGNDEWGARYQSPVVADVDGNGSLEVLITNNRGVVILSGYDGSQLSCATRTCNTGVKLVLAGSPKSTPAIGDLNNDGILDIVMGGTRAGNAVLFSWTNLGDVITSPAGAQESFSAPFPMHRMNAHRNPVVE